VSDFFELFNPGAKHTREQRDLENSTVVDYEKGGWGPKPHDLNSGQVTLRMPRKAQPPASDD